MPLYVDHGLIFPNTSHRYLEEPSLPGIVLRPVPSLRLFSALSEAIMTILAQSAATLVEPADRLACHVYKLAKALQ